MVGPELHIHGQGLGDILRRAGQPAGQRRVEAVEGLLVDRPVGNPLHVVGLVLGLVDEGDQLVGPLDVLGALDDRPVVHAVKAVRPDHGELVPFLVGRGDAAAVDRGHGHVTRGQPLHRLGAGLPPLDMRLELVELGEGPLHPGRSGQHLVDVLALHPIGEQGELQVVHRALAQAALAGKTLHVPEVRPGLRRLGELAGVVGQGHAPDHGGRAAFLGGIGDQLVGAADALPVEPLEQPLLATAHQVGRLDLHQVPIDAAGIGHHLDPRHFAVVLALRQRSAAGLGEGFEEGVAQGLLPCPAVPHHHHVVRRLGDAQGGGQCQPGQQAATECVGMG
ncbi:hypothetical protein D9M68_591320 [compost metagenome]